MTIRFSKKDLESALKRLGLVITSKTMLPVLEDILFVVTKKGVVLTTTDLSITVCYTFPIESKDEGMFLIPFKDLKNIVAVEEGEIAIKASKNKVEIFAAEDKFSLGTGDAEDFPKIPTVASTNKFHINGTFIPSLSMASITASKDDLRPAMTNIYLNVFPGTLTVCSTDANQLYERIITTDTGKAEQQELLIPPRVAKILEGFSETTIGFNKTNVSFESGPVTVYARRGEGQFPAYKAAIPQYYPNVKLKLGEIETALEKALIISKQDALNKVTFVINDTEMYLKAHSEDADKSAEARISCESTCDTGEICFNASKLSQALEQLRGHASDEGNIEMSISAPNKAVIFKVAGQNELTVLMMPIINN